MRVVPSKRTADRAGYRVLSRVIDLLPRVRFLFTTLLFWGAIVLPVFYLSLLVIGIESTEGLLLFFALFGLHVFTLIGGRSHRRMFDVVAHREED